MTNISEANKAQAKKLVEVVARRYYETRWPDGFKGYFWGEITRIELFAESEAVKECYDFAHYLLTNPELPKAGVRMVSADQTPPRDVISDFGIKKVKHQIQNEMKRYGFVKCIELTEELLGGE